MRNNRPDRLDSWKEIADYLRREVRTAIRWEKEKGLPVHRVPGGKRHAVFAYSEELDVWLRGLENSGDIAAHDAGHAIPPDQNAPAAVGVPSPKPFYSYKFWYLIGSALLVLLAVVSLIIYNRNLPGPPERITFSGHSIQAWDGTGRYCWEYQFPYMFLSATSRLGDRDGDGRNDFAVVVPSRGGWDKDRSDEVFCFDGQGRVLWRYAPNLTFNSASRHFDPPWVYAGDAMTLSPRSKPRYIWVAYNQTLWWPGCLIRLDLEGRASVRFTNSGWITFLNSAENASGSYILATGINSEYDQGMLAVIKEDGAESASPHSEGSNYVLDECPRVAPYRYFLFPRTELNLATTFPVNNAGPIGVRADAIEVRTIEASMTDGGPVHGIFLFSSVFDLTAITRTDTYWDLHRKLEKEGVIKHPVEKCPERTAPFIKGWDPDKGWTVVRPNTFPVSK